MNNVLFIIMSFCLLSMVSCKGAKNRNSNITDVTSQANNTPCIIDTSSSPGVKEIGSNIYLDRHEISNINYKMYLSFIGENSNLDLLPDTSVWENIDVGLELSGDYSDASDFFKDKYFRDASFDDHPLVGISYEQALAYTKWRTDRVFQMMLIENGCIEAKNVEDEFTVDIYFKGEFRGHTPNDSIRFPLYTLIDYDLIRNTEYIKNLDPGHAQSIEYHKQALKENKIQFTMPMYRVAYDVDRLVGNVAEMTDKKGVAFGGSWIHNLKECHLDSIQYYTKPTNWLGFRNMVRFVTYDEYVEYYAKME